MASLIGFSCWRRLRCCAIAITTKVTAITKGHDHHEAGRGGALILIGSSLHNLCDGILVAAAFLTDTLLGDTLTAASIIVHEVPHKLSDFVVPLNAGLARRRAFSLIRSPACVQPWAA